MASKRIPSMRPAARQPPPVTPEEILKDIHRRVVRMETRQGRVMEHLGLDSRGDPIKDKSQP